MSKKFFSLIHGEKIHLAPKTKIIQADALSTLLEAKDVLNSVKEDAKKYRIEVASDCEQLKEQAEKEGFEQGYQEWIEKIAELEEEILKVRKETESMVIPIALKAAKKIVGRELEISPRTVVDIIKNCLKAVATHKKIKIYVNKKDFDIVDRHKEELKKLFEHLESLAIIPRADIEMSGCSIETEGGIINAELENQWMILENAFQKLMTVQKTSSTQEEKQKAKEKVEEELKAKKEGEKPMETEETPGEDEEKKLEEIDEEDEEELEDEDEEIGDEEEEEDWEEDEEDFWDEDEEDWDEEESK